MKYQLQINKVPANWIPYGTNNNTYAMPLGNHTLVLRNTDTGCMNVIPFTANCL